MFQVFYLRLTVKQSATDPAGGAEVMSIEEELKVVVREPSEQEEQLGLEEEEMVGEQSELGGEQEEMELEVVMGRQSERMVVVEVKRETLSQDKEQWGQQEVLDCPTPSDSFLVAAEEVTRDTPRIYQDLRHNPHLSGLLLRRSYF